MINSELFCFYITLNLLTVDLTGFSLLILLNTLIPETQNLKVYPLVSVDNERMDGQIVIKTIAILINTISLQTPHHKVNKDI